MGTIAIVAGSSWGLLLLLMFVSVSLVSRVGDAEKERRLKGLVEKGGQRDAAQLLANGAVFTIAALGNRISPAPAWHAIAAGALSFSAADTWATEIGTLARGNPRSILNGRPVPVGTSGGVSLSGMVAAIGGALFISAVATFAGWPVSFAGVVIAGVLAAIADSVIGATLQVKRRCPRCDKPTERIFHDCGTKTEIVGGLPALDNDAVNGLCSVIGALIALALS